MCIYENYHNISPSPPYIEEHIFVKYQYLNTMKTLTTEAPNVLSSQVEHGTSQAILLEWATLSSTLVRLTLRKMYLLFRF